METKTNDDKIKELKYKMEKHDHENSSKSLIIDNEYYKKQKSSKKESFVNYQ